MKKQLLNKIIILLCFSVVLLLVNSATAQTRYWVGGTGSWTNTAKWSTTSGGAGGAAVPLSTDDVVFDAASGGGTLTIPAGLTSVAKSITFLAATSMSVITGTGRLDLTDGLTLRSGMILSGWTGQLFFYTPASVAVTRTITTGNNTFCNSLIQFEKPSSGVGGNVEVNGDFNRGGVVFGDEIINLQNKANYVTFNNGFVYDGLLVQTGTINLFSGFSRRLAACDIRTILGTSVFNSWGNGSCNIFYNDGETNLNAGATVTGNNFLFDAMQNSSSATTSTGSLSVENCSVTITIYWSYANSGAFSTRTLNASGSTIRFTNSATNFYPENFTFNTIICDDNSVGAALNINFSNNAGIGHILKPSINTLLLDRNINFVFDNTYLPALCWPTVNTLMQLTPNHRYAYSSVKGEAIGSAFRFNIPNGSTLEMLGTCDKPIFLDKMAWEFGVTAVINSDNVRTTNVLATDNTTPFAICVPTKPMGTGSYAITGTSTSYAGWDISTTNPAHRNLVWVGNYNNTTPTVSIMPTLPLTTSNATPTGLVFTVNSPVVLKSVDVYGTNTSASAQNIVSSIVGSSGTIVGSVTAPLPVGSSNTLYTINYNVALAPGTYTINRTTITSFARYQINSPQSFPINLSTASTPSIITISAGIPIASNYYNYYNWQLEDVAGNNNWYDPNNWVDVTALPTWSTNPSILPGHAGFAPTCPPTHRDSVIFPSNSYVYCDKLVQYCEGVNWQGTGRIYGTTEKDMEVWGSLYLSPQMQNDFKGTHWFKSDRTYSCWITTNNQSFDLGVVFNSANGLGKWLLQDSLIARNVDVDCSSGNGFISSGVTSFKLARGHLMTGTANCVPGNGKTIEVFGMILEGGTISLYDSDILIYGEATQQYNFNFVANKSTTVKINAGTSHFIFMDKYNPGAGTATSQLSGMPKAVFGSGHRLHEITLKKPSTGTYTDYTNILYLSLDTIAKITAEPGTSPIFGTFLQPGTTGSTITYSAAVKAGGLVRRLDFQSTSPAHIAAYQLNTAQYPTGADNTYSVTIDSLTTNGSINFTENTNIRSYLKLAAGKAYSLGTSTTGATAISINLMGASTLSYNPFNCGAPYGASYTGASASIIGNCLNYINITNGSFIANSTSTFVVDYLNITDNVVTGPNGPFNYSNSNLSGVTTGWNGVVGAARKLHWKDVSATNANSGDWNDANYWELISGGTGTQTVIAPAPQCPPTRVDTVVFDNSSFTANNQRVNLPSVLTEIASIYWQNITAGTNPQFYTSANTNALHIYASLSFHTNMQQNFSGPILFRGQPTNGPSTFSISTITCGNKPFNNKITFQADGSNKIWSLQDSLTALSISTGFLSTSGNGSFNLIRGEFRTNGKSMYLGTFNSNASAARKIDITNSTITVNQGYEYSVTYGGNSWIVCGTPSTFSLVSTRSTINFIISAIQGIIGGGKKYNNLNFKGFSNYAGIFGGGVGTTTVPNVDKDTFNIITFTGTGLAYVGKTSSVGAPYTSHFSRFKKVIANSNIAIQSSSCEFDTLIMNNTGTITTNNKYNNFVHFTGGKTYNMGSNTVQWFGNRCEVDLYGLSGSNIQMYSTTTSQQAYFRKDSGYLCSDYINMRDIWAIGNGNNIASCTSYSVTGINTNCTPAASFSTHAVSSCDTITDLTSSCGPWDGINFARGRTDFNAGANADLQGNDAGWAKRGYPPNPVISLTTNNYSVCPGNNGVLSLSGVANPPFRLVYLENGVAVTKTISTVADLTTYTASTSAFTYTMGVNPTVNTQYKLGYIVIDRCFNPQSITGTGTVNVSMLPVPVLTSITNTVINDGETLNIALSSNPASTYSWIAGDNMNTSGESLTTQTTGTINNTITNHTEPDQTIIYTVTPVSISGGCLGSPQTITVTVRFSIVYLPVELISFSSNCKDKSVILKWETASEKQNGFYTIKKSVDGVNWGLIATVKGKGTIAGKQTYSYIDNSTTTEGPIYYQIQQTDLDGETKNLSTITETCSDNTKKMEVLGNIVSERNSNINIITPYDGIHRIALYDMLGKQIFSEEVLLMNGRNLVVKDFSTISEGIYLFSVEKNGNTSSTKMIVNKTMD